MMTGTELQTWRERHGLRPGQLAALLGVSPGMVSRWELGNRPVPGYLHLALHALEHCPPPGFRLPDPDLAAWNRLRNPALRRERGAR